MGDADDSRRRGARLSDVSPRAGAEPLHRARPARGARHRRAVGGARAPGRAGPDRLRGSRRDRGARRPRGVAGRGGAREAPTRTGLGAPLRARRPAGFLLPAVVLGGSLALGVLAGPRAALAYAVVAFGGWISLTIVGMMLKIVPFLVWYRTYAPRAGREPRAHARAARLAAGGSARPTRCSRAELRRWRAPSLLGSESWTRGAGIVLALGALAFVAALGRVLGHLRGERPRRAEARARWRAGEAP